MPPPPTTQPRAHPAASAFAEALAPVVATILEYLFRRLHGLGPTPVGMLIYNRISRANQRVQRLMQRLATGTWRAPKPHTPRPKPDTAEPRAPRAKTPYISQSKGWIGQRYGYFIRGYFGLFEHTLTKPETLALLAELPPEALKSLGRTLRPICHIFGVTPPECLRLPPRERKPRAKSKRKPKPRKLRLRTPKMPSYPTTSSTPWRIVKSKTQKFWG